MFRRANTGRTPAIVAKSAARDASAAATATANAKTPGAARAANNAANKAAAVARAAANKAAANARAAEAAAKKTSNNQAAAKKAANNQAAAAAAKKAANQAAKSAAKANTTMVMRLGRGFKNMTNKVKSLATQATALGGSAYAAYLKSNNSEALMIAATCMVLLYIAYALLGRTPKTKVSVLQAQINKANRNLALRTKTHPRHQVYRAYMRKGNVNAANKVMNVIRANFAPNVARIAAMRAQLDELLNQVVEAMPLVAPNRNVISVIGKVIPIAEKALTMFTKVADLEIQRQGAITARMVATKNAETARMVATKNAETARMIATTNAKIAHDTALARQAEQRVQAAVAPYTAQVRGAAGIVTNVATTATAVGGALTAAWTVSGPIRNQAVLTGAGLAQFIHRRRGGA